MRSLSLIMALMAFNGVLAFWRMECRGRSGLARIDPMVSPKEVSQHVHAIHGSSGFSESASYADLMAANCTSCAVTEDKSAYWTPALYFKHDDGQYELVNQVGGMLAYYFLIPDMANPNGRIMAYPEGFRMIAGDSLRRNYSIPGEDWTKPDPGKSLWAQLGQTGQDDLKQRAIGFNCLHYGVDNEASLFRHGLPSKEFLDATCTDGIRIELMFPSCWNGKDLDSHNHQDHVAYPDLVINGNCPKGFDVKLPGLFYETIWDTYAFKGVPGQFVISNGDPTGFGYHGDFIMGWKEDFLQAAVDTCTNPSGMIQDCPLFTIQDEATQNQCDIQVPAKIASEVVKGKVGQVLPGNVPIQAGPEPASRVGGSPPGPVGDPKDSTKSVPLPATSFVNNPPVESTTKVATPSSSSSSPAGGVFIPVPTTSVIPAAQTTEDTFGIQQVPPSPTPTPEPTTESSIEGYSTQWITDGNVVTKLIWAPEVVTVTEETTLTQVVTVGGPKARRNGHLHRHQGLRRRH